MSQVSIENYSQQCCGKVMFSRVSVVLSTRLGGVWLVSGSFWGGYAESQVPSGGCVYRGVYLAYPLLVYPPEGTAPGRYTSQKVRPLGPEGTPLEGNPSVHIKRAFRNLLECFLVLSMKMLIFHKNIP